MSAAGGSRHKGPDWRSRAPPHCPGTAPLMRRGWDAAPGVAAGRSPFGAAAAVRVDGFEPIQAPWRRTSWEQCRRADGYWHPYLGGGPHAPATHSSCKLRSCTVTRPSWRLGASGKRAARHIQRALPRRAAGVANACAAPEQCADHGYRSAKETWSRRRALWGSRRGRQRVPLAKKHQTAHFAHRFCPTRGI